MCIHSRVLADLAQNNNWNLPDLVDLVPDQLHIDDDDGVLILREENPDNKFLGKRTNCIIPNKCGKNFSRCCVERWQCVGPIHTRKGKNAKM